MDEPQSFPSLEDHTPVCEYKYACETVSGSFSRDVMTSRIETFCSAADLYNLSII